MSTSNVKLHPKQSEIIRELFYNKSARYVVVNASRGFGKTYLGAASAAMACQELLDMPYDIPNKNVSIVASTHSQVVDTYFPLLMYRFGLDKYAIKSSRPDGKIVLPNNVELKMWSYESIDRMRGTGQYFVVCDEITSWIGAGGNVKEAWESVIQPTITTRWSPKQIAEFEKEYGITLPSPGRALIISTPRGHDYFYEMWHFSQQKESEWKSYSYSYKDSPLLDYDEIERTKKTIDRLKFNREYLASFDDSGNNVFYNFKRAEHVVPDLKPFSDDEIVHVGIDFNVGIMASVAFAIRGGKIEILDEFNGHPDTETLARDIKKRFPNNTVIAYPDPSGRARKTSAPTGRTDFKILLDEGIQALARKKNPPIADSVQAVNKMLKTGDGEVHMLIHPDCGMTIKSMERTVWVENNPNTATIDKTHGLEHWGDALRYAIEYLFPVKSKIVYSGQSMVF